MRDFLTRLDQALVRRPVPVMCFTTSMVALVAAGFGSLINYALAEAMAVGGMLAVSLFFLALGLLHRNDEIDVIGPKEVHTETKITLHHGRPQRPANTDSHRWSEPDFVPDDEDVREPLEADA